MGDLPPLTARVDSVIQPGTIHLSKSGRAHVQRHARDAALKGTRYSPVRPAPTRFTMSSSRVRWRRDAAAAASSSESARLPATGSDWDRRECQVSHPRGAGEAATVSAAPLQSFPVRGESGSPRIAAACRGAKARNLQRRL
ncbi:hypothetical protein MTO96_037287 [Rhipicephalus appendiculatus]